MSVDVRGKFGKLSKTVQVYTNDPLRPVTTLMLGMRVKDAVHMKTYPAREIFSTQCRGCHLDRGSGKKGMELFNYDCAICHGRNSDAPSPAEMRGKPKEHLADALRNGVKNTSMPGWAERNGGPFGEAEIRSLVDFLSGAAIE